jgi:hypothetical protein
MKLKDKPVFEIFSRTKNLVGEPYFQLKIYADGKVEGVDFDFAIVNRIPAYLQQRLLRWCETKLEWTQVECIPPQTSLYEEARDECMTLWENGWITKFECKEILINLYHKRYLTSFRPVIRNEDVHGRSIMC